MLISRRQGNQMKTTKLLIDINELEVTGDTPKNTKGYSVEITSIGDSQIDKDIVAVNGSASFIASVSNTLTLDLIQERIDTKRKELEESPVDDHLKASLDRILESETIPQGLKDLAKTLFEDVKSFDK